MSKAKSRWWYERDGQKQGPFRNRDIRQLVQSRVIHAQDLLVQEKAGRFRQVAAGDIPGLFRSVRTARTERTLRFAWGTVAGGLLVACLLNPWSEVTASLTGVLRTACVTLGMVGALAAVLAPVLCAIRLPRTYKKVPINAVLQADRDQEGGEERPSLADSELPAGIAGEVQPAGSDGGGLRTPSLTDKLVAASLRYLPILCGAAASVAVSALLGSYLTGSAEPFRYRPVSGQVTYADGTILPAEGLQIVFYPQNVATDVRNRARAGRAVVDGRTGMFSSVTSRKAKDGLLRGRHKVTLHLPEAASEQLGQVFDPEYSDVSRTPLSIDVTTVPIVISIEKPTEAADSKNTRSVLSK